MTVADRLRNWDMNSPKLAPPSVKTGLSHCTPHGCARPSNENVAASNGQACEACEA